MTRTLLLSMKAGDVMAGCLRENVGVSAIEELVSGGVRLVCMSSNGAARIRIVLKAKLIQVSSEELLAKVERSPSAASPDGETRRPLIVPSERPGRHAMTKRQECELGVPIGS